jgi:hypothetical protein
MTAANARHSRTGPAKQSFPVVRTHPSLYQGPSLQIEYNKRAAKDADGYWLVSESGAMWRGASRSEQEKIDAMGTNPLFGDRQYPPANLKSAWSIGRANEEAYKAGHKGDVTFREWLRVKKLDDRSAGQIKQLGQSYDEGVAQEHQDAVARHRGKEKSKKAGELEQEVASALVSQGAHWTQARDAASEAVKGGGGFDEVFKRGLKLVSHTKTNPAPKDASEDFKAGYRYYTQRIKTAKGSFSVADAAEKYSEKFGIRRMSVAYANEATKSRVERAQTAYEQFLEGTDVAHNDRIKAQHSGPGYEENPAGHGHWTEFTTEDAAKKFARLMEGEGKVVTRLRKAVKVETPGPVSERNPIQDPNSSGQGYDPDHGNPFESLLSQFGYSYSHSTPVRYKTGVRIHHTYKKGNHNIGVERDANNVWHWDASKGGSGHSYSGWGPDKLEKYLEGRSKRKSNPESTAADMYESFHGTPSQQVVTFEETEHYHEYLAELGICCGVLVETESGHVQAIGLSGYEWKGKGKDAGFVAGRETGAGMRENPQQWVWPKKSGKKNLEHVGDGWAILHDIGFSGKHTYRAGKLEGTTFVRVPGAETVYKRSDALAWIREQSKNPRHHRGPFRQASDLFLGGAGQLDDALGDVLAGKNPVDEATSFHIGPYSEHAPAHDKAIKLQSAGYRGLQIIGSGSRWYVYGVARQGQDIPNGGKLGSPAQRNPSDSISPDTTLLSSNEDGTQLYLVGGDQSLDLDALGITGDSATKELVTVGDCIKIYYETEKDFDQFETIQYHHELGEETGELPVLAYDRMNQRLLFVGGAYRIEKPLMETSPGIEN